MVFIFFGFGLGQRAARGALKITQAFGIDVCGLSSAQGDLVPQIVNGDDISFSARVLGISPDTAKTQLQRICDKTGVQTLPALVCLMLSAVPISA